MHLPIVDALGISGTGLAPLSKAACTEAGKVLAVTHFAIVNTVRVLLQEYHLRKSF